MSPWAPASRDLTLAERMLWVRYDAEDGGRPTAWVDASGALLGAGFADLARAGHLAERDGRWERSGTPADPLLAWILDGVGGDGDAEKQVTTLVSRRSMQVARRVGRRLGERPVAAYVPRRVLGIVRVGSRLEITDLDALRHDRAAVRAVLDGTAEPDADTGVVVALLHHGGLVGQLDPADEDAAKARAARLAEGGLEGVGGVADEIRRAIDAATAAMVVVIAVSSATTAAAGGS